MNQSISIAMLRRARSHIRCVLLACLLVLVPMGAASAQVFQAFAPRYSTVANGRLVFLANTSMTCAAPSGGSCPAVANKNDSLSMVNAKLAADAGDGSIFNSSSSDLTLAQVPAGAQVVKAQLYWGGLVVDASGTASPNPVSSPVRLGTPASSYVQISPQNCSVSPTITIWGGAAHHVYECGADVTNAVRAGGIGTYRVANVPLQSGATNRFGGWTLVVVVQDPAAALRNFTISDGLAAIATTGSNPVNQVSLTVSGFRTPLSGTVNAQLGWVAYDGDTGAVDGFTFQGEGSSTVNITDACNPLNDVFNSTICSLGSVVATRSIANGNSANTLGFDADIVQLANPGNANLHNGATYATLTAKTASEGYAISVLTTAIDVYQPTISGATAKSQQNLTHPSLPAGQAQPGDQIRYTLVLNNSGQDNATNTIITDAIPAGTDYVPGTLQVTAGADTGARTDAVGDDQAEVSGGSVVFRVGTGATATQGGVLRCTSCVGAQPTNATVTFVVKVRADAAAGSTIPNTAAATFTGASSGQDFNERTNTTVLRIVAPPRLTLAKSIAGRSLPTDQFTVSIDNGGPSATSTGTASSVTTTVFTAVAGTTYTLAETGAGSPQANLANYNVSYSCANVDGGTTQVPSGNATSFQVTPVNGDDITCTFTNTPHRADLSITKTNTPAQGASDQAADTVTSGAQTTYSIVVRNNGPDAATGAIVKDPAPTGMSCTTPATCTGTGCPAASVPVATLQGPGAVMGTMAAGTSATFTLTCTVN